VPARFEVLLLLDAKAAPAGYRRKDSVSFGPAPLSAACLAPLPGRGNHSTLNRGAAVGVSPAYSKPCQVCCVHSDLARAELSEETRPG